MLLAWKREEKCFEILVESLENLKENMNSKNSLWMAIYSFAVSGAT
jgi:hypothetical protein